MFRFLQESEWRVTMGDGALQPPRAEGPAEEGGEGLPHPRRPPDPRQSCWAGDKL